jgi:hypothetical protein
MRESQLNEDSSFLSSGNQRDQIDLQLSSTTLDALDLYYRLTTDTHTINITIQTNSNPTVMFPTFLCELSLFWPFRFIRFLARGSAVHMCTQHFSPPRRTARPRAGMTETMLETHRPAPMWPLLLTCPPIELVYASCPVACWSQIYVLVEAAPGRCA